MKVIGSLALKLALATSFLVGVANSADAQATTPLIGTVPANLPTGDTNGGTTSFGGAEEYTQSSVGVTVGGNASTTSTTLSGSSFSGGLPPTSVAAAGDLVFINNIEPVTAGSPNAGIFFVHGSSFSNVMVNGSPVAPSSRLSGGSSLIQFDFSGQTLQFTANVNAVTGGATFSAILEVVEPGAGAGDQTAVSTTRLVNQFLTTRTNLLLSNQPDVAPFLAGDVAGRFNANVTRGSGAFDVAANLNQNIWIDAQGIFADTDGVDSDYAFVAIGAHRRINPNLLVGGLVQVDYLDQDDGVASVEGTGYLIGPYFAAKLSERNLFVEGRVLYGQSRNDISPLGTFTDEFDSERLLAQVKLSGTLSYGETVLTPNLRLAYGSDDQDAYTDSEGNRIASQKVELGQLEMGVDFSTPLAFYQGAGSLDLTGGVSVIGTTTSNSGLPSTIDATDVDGARGRVELGLDYVFSPRGTLIINSFYDGVGAGDFDSYGLGFNLSIAF